jgi:tetratricopeptide (TPR) repeat protein
MDDRLKRLITLGREHYTAREYDKAEKYLAQVVSEHPGFADVFNMLGVIYHDAGRFMLAEEAFEKALAINPNYTEAALNLSVTYNDLGKYAQAREIYSKALARSRQSPRSLDPFVRGKIANMHADLGAAYGGVDLFPEAVREYQRALDLCPTFVDLRTRLANVYREMGDHAQALREFERIASENDRYVPARVSRGLTLFALGRKEEAIAEWEAVLQLEPGHKQVVTYLTMVRAGAESPVAGATLGVAVVDAVADSSADPAVAGDDLRPKA